LKNSKTKIIFTLNNCLTGNLPKDSNNFWVAFINLQKSLPSDINAEFITLMLNKDYDNNRFEFVFNPILKNNYKLKDIKNETNKITNNLKVIKDYINLNNKIKSNFYKSAKESYFLTYIANFLVNPNINLSFKQIIFLNWDLLNKKGIDKEFIYDNSLPADKIYFRYSENIDIGFSTNWIIIPKKFLNIFTEFQDFFYNSLENNNDFIDLFCFKGWISSYKKSFLSTIFDWFSNKLKELLIQILDFINNYKFLKFIKIYKYDFFISKLRIFLNIPILNYENSFIENISEKGNYSLRYKSIVNPILKYFIYKNNLRNEIRFIKNDDFQNYNDEYIINQKEFILILNEETLNDPIEIRSLINKSIFKPSYIICILEKEILLFKYSFKSKKLTYKSFQNFSNNINNIYNIISRIKYKNLNNIPLLVLPSINTLLSCNDLSYFNALLQFFIWENYDYINLFSNEERLQNEYFPDLYYAKLTKHITLNNCLISYKFFKKIRYYTKLDLNNINIQKFKLSFLSKNKDLFTYI